MASLDNVFVIIQLFGLAVFFLVGLVFWNALIGDEVTTEIWDKTPEGISAKNNAQSVYNSLDVWFILIFFFLHVGVIILAFSLPTHPVVYVVSLFVIVISVMLAAPLSNAWNTIAGTEELADDATQLTLTDFFMDRLPFFSVIFGFLTAVILFGIARTRGGLV